MRTLQFHITQDVVNLGIHVATVRITGVHNTGSHPDFDTYKDEILRLVQQNWEGKDYKDDPVLTGFRDLHTKVGRSNRDYVASPEALLGRFLKTGRFPHINLVVDIYNLLSIYSRLALGAHNIDKVVGDITLKETTGNEHFLPLGSSEEVSVFPGEYGYIDEGNNIICRMEVLQVEPTKVTEEANDIFFIIQGNANTTNEEVKKMAQELCELVTKYCGGVYTLLETSLV